jgi:GT2 family glycosyltransferase
VTSTPATPPDLDPPTAELTALRELRALVPGASAEGELPEPIGPAHVTAVLVAHDGARWLPDVLAALMEQTRPPDRVVAVDAGSRDETGALLRASLGPERIITLPRDTGFGGSVAGALASLPAAPTTRPTFVWLLHDDCAPAPTALEELLRAATAARGGALFGCKQVDWEHPRVLVEIGVTVDRSGRRLSGLDGHELDQGQHDGVRDVLAVGTAGLLVRGEAWDALGGLDVELPLFRDDVDFGWRAARAGYRTLLVPTAVVRHARAAATGRRPLVAVVGPPRRADRCHAVHVQAANTGSISLPFVLVRLVLGGLLRALGFLLTRRPLHARDEFEAVGRLVGAPGRLVRARRWRAGQSHGNQAGVRALLAPRGAQLRARLGAAGGLLVGSGTLAGDLAGALETGPSADEELLPAEDTSRLRAAVLRPSLLLAGGLVLLTLAATRELLGSGQLTGGRLLPVPAGASDLWRSWAATWHAGPAGGSGAPAAPWTPWLALLSTLTFGRPGLAVDLLLLGAAPLAGLAAWSASRRLVTSPRLRIWAALAWATLPVVTGSVAGGRFDTCVVAIALPWLLVAGHRLMAGDPRVDGWRRAWLTGLVLAMTVAFSPQIWLLAGALGLGAAFQVLLTATPAARAGARRRALAVLVPLVVPPLLVLPWLSHAVREPGVLLTGLGRLGGVGTLPVSQSPGALDLLTARPGGPGLPPGWLLVPLVVAALAALVRGELRRRRTATALWLVALTGLAFAVLAAHTSVRAAPPFRGWAGPALLVASAGILGAAVVSGEHLRARLASQSFGWRQLAAGVLAVVCLVEPVVVGLLWVANGADSPLERARVSVLPPDVLADAAAGHDAGQRVLVVARRADGTLGYDLRGLRGPQLGDEELPPSPGATRLLTAVVRDLASNRGTDAAETLATFDVRVVVVPGDGPPPLAEALDSQPALARRQTPYAVGIWEVERTVPTGRLQLLPPALAGQALAPSAPTAGSGRGPARADLVRTPPTVLPSGPEGAHASVPPGPAGRLLVLSDSADRGWRATVNGTPLPRRTAWGWAQAFVVPAGGGPLVISRASTGRTLQLMLVLVALFVVVVLAAPSAGRDDEILDDPLDDPLDDTDAPRDDPARSGVS